MSGGSHESAISSILRTFQSLVASLDREGSERGEPAAVGLVKFVKTYYFVACCKLLSKVLSHINQLSLLFQREDVDLSAIQPNLNATIHAIEQYYDSDIGAQQFENELSAFEITVSHAVEYEFKERVQKKYVDSVIAQLRQRFPHVDQLALFSLFDPSHLPSEHTNIGTYSDEELEVLCDLYRRGDTPDVDVAALKAEWEGLRFLMLQNYSQNTTKEVLKILVAGRTISHIYPQLRKQAAIALILPVSTAECERAFSTMKRVKTALRNRLITANLDHLMRISINGPTIQNFDFLKAATSWGNQRQRRIQI